jgi:hypothetical protein
VTGKSYYKRKLSAFWTISRFGTYSVGPAINAGLDLEMPGKHKRRTFERVEECIAAKQVHVSTVKEQAKKVLGQVQKRAKETISRFDTHTGSMDPAINAGLDPDIPGENERGTAERVGVSTIKERAKKVLELVQKCAKETPDVCGGDILRLSCVEFMTTGARR